MTSGYRTFTVVKPAWWKRHVVEAHMKSGLVYPMARFWSWDKADDLAEKLNTVLRESS